MADHPGRDEGSDTHEVDRLEIALHVSSDDLDPERVTRMLGVTPTFACRKGEQIDQGGVPITQPRGLWCYALPASPEWEFGDAIDTLLERLPADPALWESMAGWAEVSVVCGLYVHDVGRSTTLPPDTLGRLAERRLTLRLEIHGPAPE